MLLRTARLLTLLLASATGLAAPARAQTLPSDAQIERILQTRVDSARAVGIVVGIVENGQRRFISAGSAGAGRTPLSEHTLFEIGSISKVFTGLLLAEAARRGEVRLDQPVAELLPRGARVPARDGQQITLAQLSTHRSGLPRLPSNLTPPDPADPYAAYGTDDLLAFLASHQLEHVPGTHSEYSNVGVGLLGVVLARRAGTSWEELVHRRITGPLGMRESFVTIPPRAESRFSAGHSVTMEPVPYWNADAIAGAGALRSTAADMLTFLEAGLAAGSGPLGEAMAMTLDPRAPSAAANARMGLGWIIRDLSGRTIATHGGGTGGFATVIAMDPARRLGVVVLSNAAVPVDDILLHLLNPSLPLRMPPVPLRIAEVTLTREQLDRVVGEYALSPAFSVTVTREGDALWAQATGQQRLRLYASAPDRFFLREVAAEVHFHFEGDGPAVAATLHQGGAAQRGERVR
jgi:serine-type D-Ala-D-Ala carboxypeptidase/endopeptidase